MGGGRAGAIVQARLGSVRLPGKVLAPIEGRSMLARVVERLRACAALETIVVALPDGPENAPLAAEAERTGAAVWCGPERDVLARVLGAANANAVDPIVRITADCPLLDPSVVERTLAEYRALAPGVDLVCNTWPRRWPRGLDTEVVAREALARADLLEADPAVREHVTLAIYRRPETFRIAGLAAERDLSHHRFTVDTPKDLAFVRAVYRALGGEHPFGLRDVLELLEARPDLAGLNSGIEQRGLPR